MANAHQTGRSIRAAALLAALVALAACEGPDVDYRQKFAVGAQPETVSLPLQLAGPTDGFVGSEAAFTSLVQGYLDRGHGLITVTASAATASDARARAALDAVRNRLVLAGVPAGQIATVILKDGTAGMVVLSYVRFNAVLPQCGDWTKQLAFDYNNSVASNFGCALQRDVGLMVADPADLVGMQQATPTDAQNAARVMTQYRAGQPTAAIESPLQESGAIGIANVGH